MNVWILNFWLQVIPRKLVQVVTPSTTTDGNIGPDAVHLLAIKEVCDVLNFSTILSVVAYLVFCHLLCLPCFSYFDCGICKLSLIPVVLQFKDVYHVYVLKSLNTIDIQLREVKRKHQSRLLFCFECIYLLFLSINIIHLHCICLPWLVCYASWHTYLLTTRNMFSLFKITVLTILFCFRGTLGLIMVQLYMGLLLLIVLL